MLTTVQCTDPNSLLSSVLNPLSIHFCGAGPNNARANVDLEDPIHSKLEKAIDFHDDSEENRT